MKGQRSWCSGIGTRLKVGVLNLSEILNRVKQKKKKKKRRKDNGYGYTCVFVKR